MTITGIVIVFYTHRDVENTILKLEKSSAKNVLKLIEINISGIYNKLLFDKLDMIKILTEKLKNTACYHASFLELFSNLTVKGIIEKNTAQEISLKWLESTDFQDVQSLIFDQNSTIIAHSNDQFRGKSITSIRDIKGREISKLMNVRNLKHHGESAVFLWPDDGKDNSRKKLGYFVPFDKWNWTLCTFIDFEQIEEADQKKLEEIIGVLTKTFEKIS